jgi:hypothetical protein
MFLYFTVFDYLDWKLFGTVSLAERSDRIVGAFVISILGGLLVGYRQANRDENNANSSES